MTDYMRWKNLIQEAMDLEQEAGRIRNNAARSEQAANTIGMTDTFVPGRLKQAEELELKAREKRAEARKFEGGSFLRS